MLQVDEPVLRIMERTTESGAVVLTAQGEVDIATVGTLRERVADACERAGDVTVDLRRITFLDCLGLRVLLEEHDRCAERGGHMDFVQGPPVVRRLFELTGAMDRLSFVQLGPARRLAPTG